ncbi:MAG TPA: hypothetical protein VNY09_02810 [Candidatus Sulfotelmatobacter sp.]|jgi:adenine-specific DNA methylase|nr:hypothetical protein [Candidatus Sulfotelmatobacter sp.]
MSQAKAVATIENPRKYETNVVEHLRHLLHAGTRVHRDPQRANFYELDGDEEAYYIHISPVTGNVVLLAKWSRQPQDCCLDSDCAVA